MIHYQQQVQKVMRSFLPARKTVLTASKCELPAHLYLQPDQNTPALLSQSSGMKKDAVSRCLKSLYEKNRIHKNVRRMMSGATSSLSLKPGWLP